MEIRSHQISRWYVLSRMVEKSAVTTKGKNNSSYVSHFVIPTFRYYSTSIFYTKQYYLYFKANLPSVADLAVYFLLSISIFSSHLLSCLKLPRYS